MGRLCQATGFSPCGTDANSDTAARHSASDVGGLLAVHDTNTTTHHQNPTEDDKTNVYPYDANGNVAQLVGWGDIADRRSERMDSRRCPFGALCNLRSAIR